MFLMKQCPVKKYMKGKIFMKIKDGYILSTIAGENVVLPSGNDLDLRRMISLNDSGRFLWEQLQEEKSEDDLLNAVVANYENVNTEEVKEFISAFIDSLRENNLLA